MDEMDEISFEVLPSSIMTGIAEKLDLKDLIQFELSSRMTSSVAQNLPRYFWRASAISLQKDPSESFVDDQRILIANAPDNVFFVAERTFIRQDIEEALPTIVKHQIKSKELYFMNFREKRSRNWLDGFDENDDTPPEVYEHEVNLIKECIRLMKPEFIQMNSPWPRHYTIPELADVNELVLLNCNSSQRIISFLSTFRNRHLTVSLARGQYLDEGGIVEFIQEWMDGRREIEFFETPFDSPLRTVSQFFEATAINDLTVYICRDKEHQECLHVTKENKKKITLRNTKYGEVPPCPHDLSPAHWE